MKVILVKFNQAVKQLISKLNNRRCSSANGLFTSGIVGAVTSFILLRKHAGRSGVVAMTSLILISMLGLIGISNVCTSNVSATSLSLSISSSTVDLDVLPKSTSSFIESTSVTTIQAATSNATGYTLTIAASDSTNPNKLIDSSNNDTTTNYLYSISQSGTAAYLSSNSYTPTYGGEWGYKPSKLNSANNSAYLPSPGTNGDTIDVTNTSNEDSPNEYTIAIGARVDSSIKVGSYTNTFVVQLVNNSLPYSFIYNDNVVSNMPSDVVAGQASSSTTAISSNVPVRDGYTFIGWCVGTSSSSNITSAGGLDTCSSTSYAAGESVPTANASNDYYFYAMWWDSTSYALTINQGTGTNLTVNRISSPIGNGTTGTLSNGANIYPNDKLTISATLSDNTSYKDPVVTVNGNSFTSGDTYTVAGNTTVASSATSLKLYFQNATSTNCGSTMYDNRGTDAYKNVAYTTATINGLCWMTRNLDLPGGTTLTSSDSNVSSDYTLPASSTSGFSSSSTAYVYNSGRTICSSNSSTGSCYSYYSYVAATAGTNPSSGAASSDICPKGWRLPTSAELTTLKNTYTTGATLTASPFLGVYAGHYYVSSFDYGGSYGYYWSSTAYDSNNAYRLYFGSSNAGVNGYDGRKFSGFSIRCVAKS